MKIFGVDKDELFSSRRRDPVGLKITPKGDELWVESVRKDGKPPTFKVVFRRSDAHVVRLTIGVEPQDRDGVEHGALMALGSSLGKNARQEWKDDWLELPLNLRDHYLPATSGFSVIWKKPLLRLRFGDKATIATLEADSLECRFDTGLGEALTFTYSSLQTVERELFRYDEDRPAAPPALDVKFTSNIQQPLHLTRGPKGELRSPLEIAGHQLLARFVAAGKQVQLTDLRLTAAKDVMVLTSHLVGTRGASTAARLVVKTDLGLRIQGARAASPPTFVIAPMPATTKVTLEEPSSELHGTLIRTRFTARAALSLKVLEKTLGLKKQPVARAKPEVKGEIILGNVLTTEPTWPTLSGVAAEVAAGGSAENAGPTGRDWAPQFFKFDTALPLVWLGDEGATALGAAKAAAEAKILADSGVSVQFFEKPVLDPSSWFRGTKLLDGNESGLLPVLKAQLPGAAPNLDPRNLKLDVGGISLTNVKLPPGADPEYVVIRSGDAVTVSDGLFGVDSSRGGKSFFSFKPSAKGANDKTVVAVLKLGRKVGLGELLKTLDPPVSGELPEELKAKDWAGIVFFDQELVVNDTVLKGIVPGEVRLAYVAVTASATPAVAASISYRNDKKLSGQKADTDWGLRLTSMSAEIRASQLVGFEATVDITAAGFGGVSGGVKPPTIQMHGALDAETGDLRFGVKPSPPVDLLPKGGFGFLQQVSVTDIRLLTRRDGGTTRGVVSVSGLVAIDSAMLGDLLTAGKPVEFEGLALELSETPMPTGNWLRLNFPSLKFPIEVPALDLGPFKLVATGLDIRASGNPIGTGLLKMLGDTQDGFPGVGLRTRVDIAALPELARKAIGRVAFDFVVACSKTDPRKVGVFLDGFAAGPIELDLLRFLRIHFEDIGYNSQTMFLVGGEIDILGKKIIEDAGALVLHQGRPGFLAWMSPAPDNLLGNNPIFAVEWALIGNQVTLPQDVSKALLDPGVTVNLGKVLNLPSKSSDLDKTPGKEKETGKKIDALVQSLSGNHQVDGWLFAAGFKVAGGFFQGRGLFQDRRYYGMTLRSDLLEKCLGFDTALSVLFTKGETAERDRFAIAVKVPKVALGAFNFSGGVVALEVAMNGDFMFDLGFPWLKADGSRAWERSLGAIAGIFQGSGGAYFRKDTLQKTDGVGKVLSLGGGLMVQFGLGVGMASPVFSVYATIGIYFIVEGGVQFDLDHGGEPSALELTGAVGIVGRAVAELKLFILQVRVEVLVSAEARATLLLGKWVEPHYLPAAAELPRDGRARIIVDFNVCVAAKAQACIGFGFFKLCVSLDVKVSIPLTYRIVL